VTNKPTELRPSIQFTIDGRVFQTRVPWQPVAELRGQPPAPNRFAGDELVQIHPGARFVTIRRNADVA
jgi:hypothetical protein